MISSNDHPVMLIRPVTNCIYCEGQLDKGEEWESVVNGIYHWKGYDAQCPDCGKRYSIQTAHWVTDEDGNLDMDWLESKILGEDF